MQYGNATAGESVGCAGVHMTEDSNIKEGREPEEDQSADTSTGDEVTAPPDDDGPLVGETKTKIDATIRISADHVQVFLDYPAVPDDMEAFIERIREELRAAKVSSTYLGISLETRLHEAVALGRPLENVLIVEGDPVIPSEDGRIEWGADFFSPGFVVDEKTGAIDYRKRAAQVTVSAGQLLATIIPPKQGKGGRDVFGRVIPPGKGQWPPVKPGSNIREEKDQLQYYATCDGRIRWEGGTLAVDQVFVVEGNVGLKTGHIDHPGALVVKGEIEPEAKVKTVGDVEVQEIIESAEVVAGGNLVVHGGILGGGKSRIVVGGRVHAKFLNDAHLEVNHDVVIEREILQSSVKTRGTLSMKQGRLVGGESIALGGVLVGQTGSDAEVPTTIIAGRDFRLQRKIDALNKEIEELEQRRDRIAGVVEPLRARLLDARQKAPKLSDSVQEAMRKLLIEGKEIAGRIDEIHALIERLKLQSKSMARPRVEVTTMIYPETLFCIGPDQLRVKDAFRGPAYAVLIKGEIHLRAGVLNWSTPISGEEQEEDTWSE
jgi:uncharacterized protein